MAIAAELFKEVFRRWPSGVAVVTSRHEGSPHGMVVGSFCSLSSEPPLVMVSGGQASRTREIIDRSGLFAISILSERQVAVFERFAGLDRAFDHDRFAGLATVAAPLVYFRRRPRLLAASETDAGREGRTLGVGL
jgi:flavin reductase (DIM6/NTAB) family NADH-FMN oxidoreductase RutF